MNKIERYLAGDSRRSDVRAVGHGIFELRHRHLNNHYRILFFNWDGVVVCLTAFFKNQEKTPKPDVSRARRRKQQWIATYGEHPPPK